MTTASAPKNRRPFASVIDAVAAFVAECNYAQTRLTSLRDTPARTNLQLNAPRPGKTHDRDHSQDPGRTRCTTAPGYYLGRPASVWTNAFSRRPGQLSAT